VTINQLAFIAMALFSLLGAIGVVFLKSPVRAALALVINFFVLGLIYFMLGNQMLGITQIIVYAGAIMVLFLFVIMILRNAQTEEEKTPLKDRRIIFGLLGSAILVSVIFNVLIVPISQDSVIEFDRSYGTPKAIGTALFTNYVWPFEIISILLLLGIVGSIMLAKRKF
jgi:NADH-quinone oxidoreductase subunit J